jgi:hypothetical protein
MSKGDAGPCAPRNPHAFPGRVPGRGGCGPAPICAQRERAREIDRDRYPAERSPGGQVNSCDRSDPLDGKLPVDAMLQVGPPRRRAPGLAGALLVAPAVLAIDSPAVMICQTRIQTPSITETKVAEGDFLICQNNGSGTSALPTV